MDYGKTLNLPKTEFSMRAGLAQKEPQILDKWEQERLYEKILEKTATDRCIFFTTVLRMRTEIFTWVIQ